MRPRPTFCPGGHFDFKGITALLIALMVLMILVVIIMASPGFGARRGTTSRRKSFKGDILKYCEIHAINSDKAISLFVSRSLFLLDKQPRGEC